jgi:hypothetical protein
MARLTTFSRLLITVVIVVGVFFAVRQFLPNFKLGGGGADRTETSAGTDTRNDGGMPAEDNRDNSGGSSAGTGTTFTPRAFSYTPPLPTGGKLKGVVELGATGFNSFIIRIDNQKNWKLEKAEFGASLVYENLASEEDIRKGLKTYIADMLGYGVGSKDIHFVVSSGAKKAEATAKITAALKTLNYYVNEVTPEQEGRYALRSALPPSYSGKAFVVDIGSGNTKISWQQGSSITALEAPGAKYYQDKISDQDAYRRTYELARQVPEGNRQTCFIIGGVPFELAKQTREGKERYTVLKAPGGYTPEGEKQKAGINIYNAIAEATGCQQFVFDWDANFTIGFLLNL